MEYELPVYISNRDQNKYASVNVTVNIIESITRVFVKDFLSRDSGLHSRDHVSPSPNHNAPLFFNGFRITS